MTSSKFLNFFQNIYIRTIRGMANINTSQFVTRNHRHNVLEKALEQCQQAGEIMKKLTERNPVGARSFLDPYLKRFNDTPGDWCHGTVQMKKPDCVKMAKNSDSPPGDTKKAIISKKPERSLSDPCLCKAKTTQSDPCKAQKKKDDSYKKEKTDPCKKKEHKPCKKEEKDPCKEKKEDPCKKNDDPCKDPCKKKEDSCEKKQDDPCKKKEDPCKKKQDDPCKKKEDPCKKKQDDLCKKKEDPCKKKKDEPCKKEDPCKKKEDPSKKKKDGVSSKKQDPKVDPVKTTKNPSKQCEGMKAPALLSESVPKAPNSENVLRESELSDIFKKVVIIDEEKLALSDKYCGDIYQNKTYQAYSIYSYYDLYLYMADKRSIQPLYPCEPQEKEEYD